jgi:hypothetical protein
MHIFLAIMALVVLALALITATGCGRGIASGPPVVQSVDEVMRLDRAAIRERLSRLSNAPAPQPKMGAMCYDMAGPPQRADYVCPHCGERTAYEKNLAQLVEWELPSCRREFKKLKETAGHAVILDERSFCRDCSPDVKEAKLVLTLLFKEGQTRDVEQVTANDLRLLEEFLAGKRVHVDWNDGETPLKQYMPRLQELLGVTLP